MVFVSRPLTSIPAASTVFSPTSLITGNGGFWRADAGVVQSSGNVSQWTDQSSFANNLTVVSGTLSGGATVNQSSPTWSATGFNSAKSGVTCADGSSNGLGIFSFNYSSPTTTCFFLIFQNAIGAASFARYASLIGSGLDFNNPASFETDYGNAGSSPSPLNCTTFSTQVGNGGSTGPNIATGNAYLFGIEFDGANGNRWSAGSLVGAATSNTATLGSSTASFLMGLSTNGNAAGCTFGFLGLTQAVLTSGDWTNLKNFANANWGTSF